MPTPLNEETLMATLERIIRDDPDQGTRGGNWWLQQNITHYPPNREHRYDPAYVNQTFGFDPQTQDQPQTRPVDPFVSEVAEGLFNTHPVEGWVNRATTISRTMTPTEMRAAANYLRSTYDGRLVERPEMPAIRARGPEIYTDVEPEDL